MKKLFFLLVIALLVSECNLPDANEVDCEELMQFTIDKTTALANGIDQITCTAQLDPSIRTDALVTFSTDYGVFAGTDGSTTFSTLPVAGKATAKLITTTEIRENIEVIAQVEDYCLHSANISTIPAYPDYMSFTTDRAVITANRSEAANLTIELYRVAGTGLVSDGIKIDLSTAPTPDSEATADVIPFLFAESGVATTSLRSATDSTGYVAVTARVMSTSETSLEETLFIEFVE